MDSNFEVGEFYEFERDSLYVCPVCGETYPDCYSDNVENFCVYREHACECGAKWTDVYVYSGFIFEGVEED